MSAPLAPSRARRRVRARAARVLACLATIAASVARPTAAHAQLFAHRAMVPVPLDDSTRRNGLLPGFSYMADLQRGWGSAGDDRAWDARLAGTIELWRVSRRTALLFAAADELVANSRRDSGFNPRGISWELSAGAAHRFDRAGGLTVHLDFVHYCRHAVDNLDTPALLPEPGDTLSQRTMSANGPRLRVIAPVMRAGGRVRVRGAVAAERYQQQWDGRQTLDGSVATERLDAWLYARGAASTDVRVDIGPDGRSSLFVRGSGIVVLFAGAPAEPGASRGRANHRLEIGWRAPGSGGALELYGATERLFDDLGTLVPRPSRVVGIGLRLAERNQF
jgi:hypothetical protein